MGSGNFFGPGQEHVTDVESQLLERVTARLNSEKSAIKDLEELDNGLVLRLDSKTAELERLSEIFAILWDSRGRVQMAFGASGVLNHKGEEIHVPGRITNGQMSWFGHEVDDDLQLVLDEMKSIYDEIHPELDTYNDRRNRTRRHRYKVAAIQSELAKITEVISPNN